MRKRPAYSGFVARSWILAHSRKRSGGKAPAGRGAPSFTRVAFTSMVEKRSSSAVTVAPGSNPALSAIRRRTISLRQSNGCGVSAVQALRSDDPPCTNGCGSACGPYSFWLGNSTKTMGQTVGRSALPSMPARTWRVCSICVRRSRAARSPALLIDAERSHAVFGPVRGENRGCQQNRDERAPKHHLDFMATALGWGRS